MEMSAEDLGSFEKRFVDTFAAGVSVAVRIASYLHLEAWGGVRRVDIWNLTWAGAEKVHVGAQPQGARCALHSTDEILSFSVASEVLGIPWWA